MVTVQDQALTEEERTARFRLSRSENVGPVTFRQLLHRFGSASEALYALPELARRGGRRRKLRIASVDDIDRERTEGLKLGATDMHLGCPGYPAPLAAIDDAPPLLTVFGNASLLLSTCFGIVGGRNASVAGKVFTRKLASEIGKAGLIIASGMARRIDTSAHEGALETGTIAVLAGGADIVFPPENQALYEAIAETGAVISEMPLGMQPLARHFPRRNRIISGLSNGIAVIEAKRRSGSLITARCAAEQGRPVFAVPAAPMETRGAGCNDLIRDGATLAQCADDILVDLSPGLDQTIDQGMLQRSDQRSDQGSDQGPPRELPLDQSMAFGSGSVAVPKLNAASTGNTTNDRETQDARALVESGLSGTPVPVDKLVQELGLPAPVVNAALLELEIAGVLNRHAGGAVSR